MYVCGIVDAVPFNLAHPVHYRYHRAYW